MSLFEWLCERNNPHPVGEVGGYGNCRDRSRLSCIITGFISIAVTCLGPILYMQQDLDADWRIALGIFVGTCIYAAAGYSLKLSPNYDNMGWAGGLFDNPFRYSDDVNRTLLFFKIALVPGRLLGIGFVDFMRLFINYKKI